MVFRVGRVDGWVMGLVLLWLFFAFEAVLFFLLYIYIYRFLFFGFY